MFGHVFYHGSIRRYVILFGTLFNEIYINRIGANNTIISTMRVPITYGPKDKLIARNEQDSNLNRPFSVVLPAMSFEMLDIVYDGSRKLNTLGRIHGLDANKDISRNVYNPVPYNMNFSLNIMVKNAEDGSKILEQILPFFTPDWTTTIKIIDNPEIIIDVPLVLNDIRSQDTWEGNYSERRVLTWTLTFTMKGFIFGPVRRNKIIKKSIGRIAYTRKSLDSLTETYDDRYIEDVITTTPGLLANGSPTSNAELTLPYSEIDWNDNYGFVVDINRNPE